MKKFNYYHVDCGHFPVQIKLCFSNEDFQVILSDHGIPAKATALDEGIAETHYLTDGKQGIIILVFDLSECDEGAATLAGTVAHEATHCVCRVFEHIGEEPEDIGEESRAYLTEHIVKQITQGIILHKASLEARKNVGKGSRKISKQQSQGKEGTIVQVDKHSDGSTGQNCNTQQPNTPSGTQDIDRSRLGAPKVGLQATRRTWTKGTHSKK